mmetsp:Transcript_16348/g.24646  ORF Transcript_16348/g.24646 Transcript_16348/m.24646 type:complete len:301 (+) Transcript_16348:193-1095(+)
MRGNSTLPARLFSDMTHSNKKRRGDGCRPKTTGRKSRHLLTGRDHHEPSKSSVDETTTPRRECSVQRGMKTGRDGYFSCDSLNTDRERLFVSTSSSMFFEGTHRCSETLVSIPISPMFTEATPGPNWDTEFFGRGATSIPSSRTTTSVNTLPGLKKDNISQPRQIFSRGNKTQAQCQPHTARNSGNLYRDVSPSPNSVANSVASAEHDSSQYGSSSRPTGLTTKRPDTGSSEVEIEPWAYKIISKYQGASCQRPLSRCTTRLVQDPSNQTETAPPLLLNGMTKSKSCSSMKATKKLTALH